MKNPSTPVRALARAVPLSLLLACGTVAVRVPVMKPAEINMAPYNSVAIGGMTGSGDRPVSEALEEALVNSQRFTVVDRQHNRIGRRSDLAKQGNHRRRRWLDGWHIGSRKAICFERRVGRHPRASGRGGR